MFDLSVAVLSAADLSVADLSVADPVMASGVSEKGVFKLAPVVMLDYGGDCYFWSVAEFCFPFS